MKILLSSTACSLTDHFPASEGLTAYNIIKHLQNYGCFFHAIASNAMIRKPLKNTRLYAVKVPNDSIRLKSSTITNFSGVYYAIHSYLMSKRILQKEKINVIHHMFPSSAGTSFSLLPLLSNMKKRYPFVFGPICSSLYSLENMNESLLRNLASKLHYTTVSKADALIVQTPNLKAVYSEIVDASRLWVIPLGVDVNHFSPTRMEGEKGSFEVLTVANLVEHKGIEYLIEAVQLLLKKYENVKLRLVGDGPYKDRFIQATKQLNIQGKVTFEGNISHLRLTEFYRRADVFCLPSLREAFGKVVIEAMACGKPIVTTNTDGPSQIVDHMKDGIIVPPADSRALSEAIFRLFSDDEMRWKMGRTARRKAVEKYSWDKVAQKYYEVYKTLSRGIL